MAAHKEAIEHSPWFDEDNSNPLDGPSHRKPVSLEAMGFGLITNADGEFFALTPSLGTILNDRLSHDGGSWRVVESDKPLVERRAGHVGAGCTGRHFDLYYNQLRSGALAIGADINYIEKLEGVYLSITFKFPQLYEFDAIYNMLRTLIVQISAGTVEDIQYREATLTQKLLRILWGIQRDEVFFFTLVQNGPGTVMFNSMKPKPRERFPCT